MRYRILVIMWLFSIFLPLFTLRLFQDEMLYMFMSMSAAKFQFLPRSSLVFILTSPFAFLPDVNIRVFLLRIATAFVTLFDILLVYILSKERFNDESAFLGSITFLLSFVVLRYGGRYTLEPWGLLFVLSALYFFDKKPLLSALLLGLAFAARETWLTLYPFFFVYVWKTKKEVFWRFVIISTVLVMLNFVFMFSQWSYKNPLVYNSHILFSWGFLGMLTRIISAWLQFIIVFPLTVVGFIYALFYLTDKREIILVVFPPLLTLNIVFGFLLNGPFERYTIGPLALMSIYSGYGLVGVYHSIISRFPIIKKITLERWVAVFLISQFLVFNIAVVELSNIGAKGIQDYGYYYDKNVFEVIGRYGKPGDTFGGTPHPSLLGFKNWIWADRNLGKVLNKDIDWLITFHSWVNINEKGVMTGAIETWRFGPYIVIHSTQRGAMKKYVTPTNYALWGHP